MALAVGMIGVLVMVEAGPLTTVGVVFFKYALKSVITVLVMV
jgi:hypothetical protein